MISKMPEAVINSSPLIGLSIIGEIDLLRRFYEKVYISKKVFDEIMIGSEKNKELQKLKTHNWIEICKIKNFTAYEYLLLNIDEGEAETIVLAEEKKIPLVIIDDLKARQIAAMRNLAVTGTLGLILKAKQKGYVREIKPKIEMLLSEGFYISNALCKDILKIAKE